MQYNSDTARGERAVSWWFSRQ